MMHHSGKHSGKKWQTFKKFEFDLQKETEKGKGQGGEGIPVQTCAISSYLFAFTCTNIFKLYTV